LLLTSSGELYWSGDPTSGACGPAPDFETSTVPCFRKMVLGPGEDPGVGGCVKMAAATWEASVFARLDGEGGQTNLYSCGVGGKGELGQGALVVRVPAAAPIRGFPPPDTEIVDLASGMSHVVVVLSNGEAYGWGNGRKGQLGAPAEAVFSPRKIEGIPFPVNRAVCGREFTCLLGEPGRGSLLVLGSDKWGIRSGAPPVVPGWKDVGASWGNVFVLTSDGHVRSWGRDDYSQNARAGPGGVLRMAIGSEHAVALLDTHDVLAWGWGEHGNCGPPASQGDSKGQRNIIASSRYIPPGFKIFGVGAGCATSWIILEESQTPE